MAIKYFTLMSNILRSHSRELIPLIRTWLLMAGDGLFYSCVFAPLKLEEQIPRSRNVCMQRCVCVYVCVCVCVRVCVCALSAVWVHLQMHIHRGTIVAWIYIFIHVHQGSTYFLRNYYLGDKCKHISWYKQLRYSYMKYINQVHQAYSVNLSVLWVFST